MLVDVRRGLEQEERELAEFIAADHPVTRRKLELIMEVSQEIWSYT